MFEGAEELLALVDGLLERPARTFALAHELGASLARYAEPFRVDRFAAGLHSLVS